MLYERWRQVAQDRRNDIALRDLASGQRWTFAQLSREAETPLLGKLAMVCPQGHSAEFIIAVLRAWRWQAVVCPLEPHKQPLTDSPPPPPCCHLKTTPPTMGTPHAVRSEERRVGKECRSIVATMGLRPDWPNLGVISLAYSYGFSNLVLPLLLHG